MRFGTSPALPIQSAKILLKSQYKKCVLPMKMVTSPMPLCICVARTCVQMLFLTPVYLIHNSPRHIHPVSNKPSSLGSCSVLELSGSIHGGVLSPRASLFPRLFEPAVVRLVPTCVMKDALIFA